ncbi:hypothetical protein FEM48_Zijuj01G0299700 [Ziziphus jujuba var. spinosa]|uniref:Fe2OG dioxygenase domain-containing protein n=1 Tax=Ziziphus jujuba var. spinosa TaxID=714518 RepID=A0A978W5V9_ZIZJJ|nr:hypothetical protein FEM48_Zijuj01G0299700 [Ziziphus jujuba var. spinosa]
MGSAVVPEPKLPILNFSEQTQKPGTNSWVLACKDVRRALEEYGCFIVLYDKITCQLNNAIFGALEDLFDLPTQTKMKNVCHDRPLNGYVGQIPKLPLHESMGIDNATTLEGTKTFTNIMWPTGNDHFSKCAYSFAKIAEELDQMVTRMIFESYGLHDKYYESYAASITYLLRPLKNKAPKVDEPTLGFVTHTDKSFTTILYQNQIDGLEVELKNGDWLKVELPPLSFVFMAGDALMAWSNDRIVSPSHRVVVSGKQDRYSLAQFSFGNGMVQVPQELVDDQHPLKYKSFDHLGLLLFFGTDEGYKSKCPIKAYCGV